MENNFNKKQFISRRSFVKNFGLVSAFSLSSIRGLSMDVKESKTGTTSNQYKRSLTGPCVSLRIPFKKDESIDYEALYKQIDVGINDARVGSLILTYGDSLYSLLSDEEISQVTKKCIEYVNKRAMLVAATGQWTTAKTKQFAAYSAKLGADMLMVLPPDWARSTTVETLVKHYAAAGEHIPIMLVNNYLGRRGDAFALQVTKALYESVPSVVALKDDVAGTLIRKKCIMTHDRWAIIAGGQKQNHINMLPYGVDGYFSLFSTFNPDIARKYWDAIKADRMDEAMIYVTDYDMPVMEYIIGLEGGFDAGMHGMLEIVGLGNRYRRLPYHTLTDSQMDKLRDFLKSKPYV